MIRVRNANVPRQTVAMDEALAAMRTALGRFVVRFPMPGDLCLGVEHFAAPANKVLPAWLYVEMSALAMQNKVGLAPETSQADLALQTSLRRVHSHVFD